MRNQITIALVLLLLVLYMNCENGSETKPGNAQEEKNKVASVFLYSNTMRNDSITIAWDPPIEGTDSIECYELFYQPVTDSGWTMIRKNISKNHPYVKINTSELDTSDSMFNFAVRSVLKSGLKSYFDYSNDTANAKGGWPLIVNRKLK